MVVDNSTQQKVVAYLKHLGLETEAAQVYLHLLRHGRQTVLSISKGLGTGRTKLYPLLEDLADKQLVTIHERHYGTSYEAQSPEVLDFLVSEHERRAQAMRSSLPGALQLLGAMRQQSPDTSKVVEYRGVDGLKQINWNLGRAEKEFRVFELKNLHQHLGKHFADKMRRRFYTEKKLRSMDLSNDPDWSLDLDAVPGMRELSQARYIEPEVFEIRFETYIYNNCVALLSYEQEDIFGVEIYNASLAAQQRQLFDVLWRMAKEVG